MSPFRRLFTAARSLAHAVRGTAGSAVALTTATSLFLTGCYDGERGGGTEAGNPIRGSALAALDTNADGFLSSYEGYPALVRAERALGTRAGDPGFVAAFDLDLDQFVGPADLRELSLGARAQYSEQIAESCGPLDPIEVLGTYKPIQCPIEQDCTPAELERVYADIGTNPAATCHLALYNRYRQSILAVVDRDRDLQILSTELSFRNVYQHPKDASAARSIAERYDLDGDGVLSRPESELYRLFSVEAGYAAGTLGPGGVKGFSIVPEQHDRLPELIQRSGHDP